MLDTLKDNSIIWLIVTICGILGFPIGILSILKKDKKELSYAVSSYEIIKAGLNKQLPFSIFYDNEVVENLSVSKIAIWNSGNQLLQMNDFVENKQLTISWNKDITVLDISLLSETDSDNKCSLKHVGNNLFIEFDYLSSKDGLIIQIYHDKNIANFLVTAKIKGGKEIKKCYNEKYNSHDAEYVKKYDKIQFFTNLYLIFCLSFFLGDSLKKVLKIQTNEMNIPLIILGLFLLITGIIILICGRMGSKFQIPKKMRKKL